jgi:hypothetical protein
MNLILHPSYFRKGREPQTLLCRRQPHPRLEPTTRLETKVSYFLGKDPASWHADVPVWGGVRYVDLYPGVDLEIGYHVGAYDSTPSPWRLVVREGAEAYRSTQGDHGEGKPGGLPLQERLHHPGRLRRQPGRQ